MFCKTEAVVLVRYDGVYRLLYVHTLNDVPFVEISTGRFVKLTSDGNTTYKTMRWENVPGQSTEVSGIGLKTFVVKK